jgi:hypothetical protein
VDSTGHLFIDIIFKEARERLKQKGAVLLITLSGNLTDLWIFFEEDL